MDALKAKGLQVTRTNWDNPDFDWSQTRFAIIRTTWDIYDDDNFKRFVDWLDVTSRQTLFINDKSTILWNMNKRYLLDLSKKNIEIPPTLFIEKGNIISLRELVKSSGWIEPILKPAISGGGRHTYHLNDIKINELEDTFAKLCLEEPMLLQEFQHNVISKGELSLMVFGGKYSHAVLKKAKPGDFRVQDDFGGTVHHYDPSDKEIAFAEKIVNVCDPIPLQARVDFIWNNNGDLCVSELELIEPELWFRNDKNAAKHLSNIIFETHFKA